jgi:hypothetical protein
MLLHIVVNQCCCAMHRERERADARANVRKRLVDPIIWKPKNIDEGLDAAPAEQLAPFPAQQHEVWAT